jgi:hypothetical protein
MSKLGKILTWLAVASTSALLSVPTASAVSPVKDQGRILIRAEGHEETFGILSSPQHAVLDYTLAVTVAGEGALSVFVRQPAAGETPDGPPRVTMTRFRLPAADLTRLQALLASARIGQQPDCHSQVPFLARSSASLPPKQRLVWFGNARRHELDAWQGTECGDEMLALLHFLADLAEDVYQLPTER